RVHCRRAAREALGRLEALMFALTRRDVSVGEHFQRAQRCQSTVSPLRSRCFLTQPGINVQQSRPRRESASIIADLELTGRRGGFVHESDDVLLIMAVSCAESEPALKL